MARYRTLAGLNYRPSRRKHFVRAEPGEVVTDMPKADAELLEARGVLIEVFDPSPDEPGPADDEEPDADPDEED